MERNEEDFYKETMNPGRRILKISSSLPFLDSWLPYKTACFAVVCAIHLKGRLTANNR
jgi:hypothetical protein